VASAATVKIDAEGGVVLSCGVTDQGGGQWTMAAQVVSEVLGVPMGQISVIMSDTEATPPDTGTGGSGTTYRVGNIVGFAAEDARRQVVRIAAERLKVDEEELVLRDGEVCVRSDPSKKLTLARVASAAGSSPGGAIIGTSQDVREEYLSAHAHELAEYVDAPSFAAHVAKVRVDPETGQIDVLKYYTAQDVGKALNLLNCTGQIEGGVVFGLGYALSEEIITEDGTNLNANLWEYLLPTAPHIPPITVDLVEIPSTYGPYGAKGVGETPCVGVAPAIANAVEDAIGARVTQAPLTPERVLAALRAKQAGV
jgi:CO/xanthine dehydrogenase Mo-binding subunit